MTRPPLWAARIKKIGPLGRCFTLHRFEHQPSSRCAVPITIQLSTETVEEFLPMFVDINDDRNSGMVTENIGRTPEGTRSILICSGLLLLLEDKKRTQDVI